MIFFFACFADRCENKYPRAYLSSPHSHSFGGKYKHNQTPIDSLCCRLYVCVCAQESQAHFELFPFGLLFFFRLFCDSFTSSLSSVVIHRVKNITRSATKAFRPREIHWVCCLLISSTLPNSILQRMETYTGESKKKKKQLNYFYPICNVQISDVPFQTIEIVQCDIIIYFFFFGLSRFNSFFTLSSL